MSERIILKAEELTKFYKKHLALDKFSFFLKAGRILGFLGPNGAGKTTAIRILTTILDPTSGNFEIDGFSSENKREIRNIIGVLPESHGFPKHMTATEYLEYFGQLYGYSKNDAMRRSEMLLNEVKLEKRKNHLIGSYSRGMRQRLGIARSLINEPSVLFLDEPTLGLDPKGQEELLSLIRNIARSRKVGIVICSHLLAEIESICDDVVILQNGKMVASGTVEEIIGKGKVQFVRIKVPENNITTTQSLLEKLDIVKEITKSDRIIGGLDVELNEDDKTHDFNSNHLLSVLTDNNIKIIKFDTIGTGLHDVFLQLTEDKIN